MSISCRTCLPLRTWSNIKCFASTHFVLPTDYMYVAITTRKSRILFLYQSWSKNLNKTFLQTLSIIVIFGYKLVSEKLRKHNYLLLKFVAFRLYFIQLVGNDVIFRYDFYQSLLLFFQLQNRLKMQSSFTSFLLYYEL